MIYKRMAGLLVISLILAGFFWNGTLRASDIDEIDLDMLLSNTEVDISEGTFAGLNAEFYFNLVPAWYDEDGNPLITVYRITYAEGAEILDWYNFEYAGKTGVWQVMRLYVFDRAKWSDNLYPLTVLMKTQDYVFAAAVGEVDPKTIPRGDREGYESVLEAVSSVSQIKKCIELAPGQTEELEYSVIVNGEVLPSTVEFINGACYIPLAEVCEAFGYTISWNDAQRKVTITLDGTFVDEFVVDVGVETTLSPIYSIRLINDRVYAVSAYFAGVLRKNVEMDDNYNVIITSKFRG